MNEVKLQNIPGAEDSDKSIQINGISVAGCVYKGWLRTGGTQWVYDGPMGKFGVKTLKEAKREISRRHDQKNAA